jgi:hypothetical protein
LRRTAKRLFFWGVLRICRTPGQRGKVIYPLGEVLLLCAVLAGAETLSGAWPLRMEVRIPGNATHTSRRMPQAKRAGEFTRVPELGTEDWVIA